MTKIYFVRHAKPDFSVHEDALRPLSEEGIIGSQQVTRFLMDKCITKVISSPYKRSIDTISHFAQLNGLSIEKIDDLRERKIDDVWIEDFNDFVKKQWSDFQYKLPSGESLYEVQVRNIRALHHILETYTNETIVIGTHGTALSTIINYFHKDFDYEQFHRIRNLMPFVVYMEFDGFTLLKMEEIIL